MLLLFDLLDLLGDLLPDNLVDVLEEGGKRPDISICRENAWRWLA